MLIDLDVIVKTYKMGLTIVRALRGVSLQISEGEYVAIMGPSGSGKSTLMNVIGCLDTPTSGSYRLNDEEIANLKDDELAHIRNKQIGFVFQTFNLLARANAFHNVELPLIYSGLPPKERKKRVEEALRAVNMEDRATHRPNELSGGQRQRIAVARALVNHPSIILADEPTGNLDSETGEEIMSLFNDLHQQGNTMIIVTHDPIVAKYAHRIIHILDGKINSDEIVIK